MPPPDARIWLGRGHARPRASGRGRRAGRTRRPRGPPGSGGADRAPRVSPTNAPRASGSGCGLRSPVRYGRKNRPSLAAATSAAASTSSPNSTPGASASRNQRRLPAAESITDIMCQRPGTAWQKAWTIALRLVERPVRRGEDDAGGPERQRHRPRARRPRRRPRWPTGRRRRRRPGCRHATRSRRRRAAVTVPVTSGPSNVGGSQAGGIRSAATTSGDQSRAARSNRIVPDPSALSMACSPVRRSRT